MHAGCDSEYSFSHIRKMTFQTLKNKMDELANKIDFSDLPELRYRTFTEKNLSGYRLPSTLDALVLHLRRAFIFFLNFLTSFIKNIKYVIEKIFLFVQNSSLHKTNFFSQMNL